MARWANGLRDGLGKIGQAERAALFDTSPPFAASYPTTEDCEHLSEYVEARMSALHDLLAEDDSPDSRQG